MINFISEVDVKSIVRQPYTLDNGKKGVSCKVVTFDEFGNPEMFKITEQLADSLKVNNKYTLVGEISNKSNNLKVVFTSIK